MQARPTYSVMKLLCRQMIVRAARRLYRAEWITNSIGSGWVDRYIQDVKSKRLIHL